MAGGIVLQNTTLPASTLDSPVKWVSGCLQVNAAMAARLLEDKKGGPSAKAGQAEGNGLLADDRFKPMFEDPAFTIDEDAEEFKSLHPNSRKPPQHD